MSLAAASLCPSQQLSATQYETLQRTLLLAAPEGATSLLPTHPASLPDALADAATAYPHLTAVGHRVSKPACRPFVPGA